MTGLLHLIKECLDIPVPVIEHSLGVLILFLESHLPCKSVDLGLDSMVDHHVADLLLSSVFWDTDKPGKG